jgi:hypothetical protein
MSTPPRPRSHPLDYRLLLTPAEIRERWVRRLQRAYAKKHGR